MQSEFGRKNARLKTHKTTLDYTPDIVATTLCRALNGNLQQPGWEPVSPPVSPLLIRKKTAPFIQLGKAADGRHPALEPHGEMVWRTLDAKSQAMVLENRATGRWEKRGGRKR